MRIVTLLCFFLISSLASHAQDPVSWKYSAKKIDDKTYEVHLTATVQSPWHIYSQFTPDGGPLPTKIMFVKNPMASMSGTPQEVGKLLQKHEEVFDVDVKYFDGAVSFVQKVVLKGKVKTNVSGSVEYMVCNDTQCLPPKTIHFTVKLD